MAPKRAVNLLVILDARAADVWAFRFLVECEAAVRFARIAERLRLYDLASPVIALAERASQDEARHADGCARLARALGATEQTLVTPANVAEMAPADLHPREALTYDIAAVCCLSETESVATLTELIKYPMESEVKQLVHEIARDEVTHAQIGWAHLAREATHQDVRFLGPLFPRMMEGAGAERLFEDDAESPDLRRYGVAPRHVQRRLLVDTVERVIAPGLTRHGVSAAPLRAWLAARQSRF